MSAELRARAEQLRRSARLTRLRGQLQRYQADLNNCPSCRSQADADEELARTCEAAAAMMLEVLEIEAKLHRQVTGLPPQPERPNLRVVDG